MTVRKGPRGLASIAQIRGERAASGPRWTTAAGATAGLAVVAGLLTHMFVSAHELNAGRQALLAKQRAVVATLGADNITLSPGIYTSLEITGAGPGTVIFQPGVYVFQGGNSAGHALWIDTAGTMVADGVLFYNTGSSYNPTTGMPDSAHIMED